MAQSVGAFTKIAIGSTRLCYAKLLNRTRHTLSDAGAETMCGDVNHHAELVDEGFRYFGLSLVMWPTPEELTALWPFLSFSETETEGTWVINSAPTEQDITIDFGPEVHTYADAKCDKWILRGQMGKSPISLQLDVLAVNETLGGAFEATIPQNRTAPYSFTRNVLTLLEAARPIDRFALACDNHLLPSWYNSPTPTSLDITDREMFLGCTTGYTADDKDIYSKSIDSALRVAGADDLSLAITRGTQGTTFTFGNAKWEATPPSVMGKRDRIQLDQHWKCYRTADTPLCTVVHSDVVEE